MTTVLVLAGGPDAEREVSLCSARAIADALIASGKFEVRLQVIDRARLVDLRGFGGDVVWPALHGRWGEGGPLQDLLVELGLPFVGCGPAAARLAMDKVASKGFAAASGLDCKPMCILDPTDPELALPLPVVAKPIFEGSTVGLFVCRTEAEWANAHAQASASGKAYMVEPFITGRELTLGMVDKRTGVAPGGGGSGGTGFGRSTLRALPMIEIIPAEGLYDYEAKYKRDDTRYLIDPELSPDIKERIVGQTEAMARAMGVRHLCRSDFILDDDNRAWFLEINTMPGFTGHSLVPMAAAKAGLEMPQLCAHLVERALAEGKPTLEHAAR